MIPQVGKPLFIETPAGMIKMSWDTSGRRRKLRIDVPGCFVVQKGEDHAFNNLRFLRMDEEGTLHPDYQLLVPVVGDNGEIVGVEKPKALTIGASQRGLDNAK